MSAYLGESNYEHGSSQQLGVLLVNLGTPTAPTAPAVRRFLAEFLSDPRVIEAPRWLWWLALHGVILRVRPAKSAHAYQQIWTESGSPLLVHSRGLTDRVRALLGDGSTGLPTISVALGMTYGSPSIPAALAQLRNDGVRRLLVLPLYPQYSGTTTGPVFDRVTSELQRWRWIPELRFIGSYHDDSAYVDALAASARERWRTQERGHLLFSFHGVPQRYLLAGDPYHCQCLVTARLVADRLGLGATDWSVSFQSQVGREQWLQPYTDQTLIQFAQQGRKRISVICPGFATDCLETLEEIEIRNRAAFMKHGGEFYDYIPALNASAAHAQLLADLVRRHAQGWPCATSANVDLDATKQRALRQGAAR
jgi:protoporphyrin/coproporphyrin ferrochelatase